MSERAASFLIAVVLAIAASAGWAASSGRIEPVLGAFLAVLATSAWMLIVAVLAELIHVMSERGGA